MKQQTLYRYFRPLRSHKLTTRQPRVTLLDLPASARTLIYRHAGLLPLDQTDVERMMMNRGDAVAGWCQYLDHSGARDMVWDPAEQHAASQAGTALCCIHCGSINIYYEPCSRCPGPCCYFCQLDEYDDETFYMYDDFPHQLFSICRLLYEETTRLFYSEARLEVAYTAPGGFGPLQRLGPLAIASLRDLVIRLNIYSCAGGPACTLPEHRRADCYSVCRIGGHDEPLGKRPGSRHDRYAWQNLRDACAHLARFLPANRLKFAFVCEVKDYGLATKLMEALLQLPPLLSCTIGLSINPDPRLRELAQETQARLTNPLPLARGLPRHFSFRDLPREIQLEVLRNSDLVAPFHLDFSLETNQPSKHPTFCIHREPLQHLGSVPVMCCCSYKAHSSSGWTCNHWHFPDSLFLVDRQMEKDARVIMYSENSWVWDGIAALIPVWNSKPSSMPQLIPRGRMQANLSRFLANARRIQIEVPNRAIPWQGEPEARQACMDHLSTLLEKCVPEKLSLALVLRHPTHPAAAGVGGFLESRLWRDQRLILKCLAAGLQGQRLREFAVGFRRKHFEVDEDSGNPYPVNCHIGKLLDQLEIEIEDELSGTERSPSHLRDLNARRVPFKIHSHHYGWEAGIDECLMCSGYPCTLLYHG